MDLKLDNFFTLGFSYQISDIDLREKLALSSTNFKLYLKELKVAAQLSEVILISTCNRFEIYAYSEHAEASELVLDFITSRLMNNNFDLKNYCFIHKGENAFNHLCKVSCSIDSMVQGEAQIFGQVKQAYNQAREAETVGRFLHKIMQTVFKLTKKVRTDTSLGQQSLSVAAISIKLIQQIFTDLSKLKIVVIGSGEIAELALIHLRALGCEQMTIVNRTIRNAEALAERFNAQAAGLHLLPELLETADVIFGSLRIDKPIFQIRELKNLKRKRSLVFIDLGLPRNFQSAIREIDDFYLYDISDLELLSKQNRTERADSVKDAELLIENSIYNFKLWLENLKSQPWRCNMREKLHYICNTEAQKIFKNKITNSALDLFSHRVAQKLANLIDEQINTNNDGDLLDQQEIELLKKELNA